MELSLDEMRQLIDICHAAGCGYPYDRSGKGSPMKVDIQMQDPKTGEIKEVIGPNWKFAGDKWKDLYEKLYTEYERQEPFSVL